MGHGYYTVVGFGIVVSIDLFLERILSSLPDAMDDDDLPEIEDEVKDTYYVNLHYEQQYERDNVFVTTPGAIVQDACGANGSYEVIDADKLNQGQAELMSFVQSFFSEFPIQLIVYSYEGY